MLALGGISMAGTTLVFTVHSVTAQNALCIISCAAVAGVVVQRLHRASDVVDAALRLAEEIARLGGELPDSAQLREREKPSLAVVRQLPGQRAAVGQGGEVPFHKDHR